MTKISSLTEIASGVDTDADFLAIVDTSATTTKKVKPKKMLNGFGVTKGNLLSTDGTDFGVLGVGSNNQVLTADSAQTYGVKWATPATGGQSGDMVYPLNVTIGDYAAPASATASSEASIPVSADLTDDMSSDNFTDQDSANIGVSGGVLNVTVKRDGSNDASSRDFGSALSDTIWICRFKLTIATVTQADATTIRLYVGFSSNTSATAASGSHDFLGLQGQVDNGAKTWRVHHTDGSTLDVERTPAFTHAPTAETLYVDIRRTTSTSYTVSFYSDSGFSSLVESQTGTCAGTTTSLRYFWVGNINVAGSTSNVLNCTIDDLQIWNNTNTLTTTYPASNTVDANNSTRWQSSSENNPRVYVDLTSARDIAAIALNIDKTNTTETQFKIRCSTDTTFTDGETVRLINISDFTDDTWRFIPINRLSADCRYVQIYGVSNSVVFAINEIKVYYAPAVTDWNRKHFHKYLDPTSATANTLDSN